MENSSSFSLQDLSLDTLEKAVVCGLLVSPSTLPDVTGWLLPEMFHSADTAFIYEAVRSLYDQGVEPDYLTTESEMRRMDSARTDAIGGITALEKMLVFVKHEVNVPHYAAEVKRQFLLRRLSSICQKAAQKLTLIETEPLEAVAELERELMDVREKGQSTHQMQDVGTLATQALEEHCRKSEKGVNESYVLSGLRELDAVFGGIHNSELFVAAGRPGEGKTALTMHMAVYAAQQGIPTCYFSMEMSNQQMMNRLFAGHAGIDPARLRSSCLSEKELEQLREFIRTWEKLPLYVDYTPANTLENIRATVLLRKRQGRCGFVLLDYIQLARTIRTKNDTEDTYLGRIVMGLKALALEADVPILILSQMNRESERRQEKYHMPQLSDLRASGAIEQAADGVFFIYNPEKHGMDSDPKTGESYKNVLLLIVRKHRNGKSGTARIRHNGSFTFFTSFDNKFF